MGFDDVLHNAQADANTLGLAAQLGATPVETLEDALVFLGGNAGAVSECCVGTPLARRLTLHARVTPDVCADRSTSGVAVRPPGPGVNR